MISESIGEDCRGCDVPAWVTGPSWACPGRFWMTVTGRWRSRATLAMSEVLPVSLKS